MKKILTILALAGAFITGAQAQSVLITEINSNGVPGDFFEIYNSGASAVDLTGWRWSDYDVRNWASAWSFDAATLNPGEVAVVATGNNGGSPTPTPLLPSAPRSVPRAASAIAALRRGT